MPVHNRAKTTARCLAELKKQTFQNYKVLLIDDGSTDGTAELAQNEMPSSVILKGDGNLWWAGSLQKAYDWLAKNVQPNTEDAVLILNDDTVFEETYLEQGLETLAMNPRALVGSVCFGAQSKKLCDAGVYVDWSKYSFIASRDGKDVNCLSTRGLFLRLSDFLKIGEFYPKVLPHYSSDYEYTLRAARMGYKLVIDPKIRLWVDEGATGVHKVVEMSFSTIAKNYFSKRSVLNPIYQTNFVILSCPAIWWPKNIAYIWARAGFHLSRAFFKSCYSRRTVFQFTSYSERADK